MNLKEKAVSVCSELEKLYPEAVCSLVYSKPYELLIATRLSAQCTDARVNIVTEKLFDRYRSLEDLADAQISELEEIVRPCGFFRTKAADIKGMCRILIDKYGGQLPDSMDELTSLPGVGRKTANLILGDIFGKPAVVTDTHCIRISGRLGLTENSEPSKVEKDLRQIVPPEKGSDLCHRFVLFGRDICKARKPLCEECSLKELCRYYTKDKEDKI